MVLGGIEHHLPIRFRQSPDFYYLTGLEEPGAVLVLNGVTKTRVGVRGAAARSSARASRRGCGT